MIGGVETHVLFDTGATHSFVSPELVGKGLFCLCSLAVGTFLRSLLPFCLSLSSFRGWWKKRPDFWLILDFSGISVLTKGRLHCSLLKSKLKIQWGGGGSFSHPGHGWDF